MFPFFIFLSDKRTVLQMMYSGQAYLLCVAVTSLFSFYVLIIQSHLAVAFVQQWTGLHIVWFNSVPYRATQSVEPT